MNVGEVGLDFRDAARKAASEEGKSLNEWLEALMEDRAEALGVDAADLGAEDRLDAFTQALNGSARRSSARRGADPAPPQAQSAAQSAAPPRDALRRGLTPSRSGEAEPAPEQASLIHDPEPTIAAIAHRRLRRAVEADPRDLETLSTFEAPRTGAPENPASPAGQRQTIEAKLNSLFSALNRTTGRPGSHRFESLLTTTHGEEAPATSAVVADHAPARTVEQDLLGRTALSPTRTLDQAIAEITERQAVLDRSPAPRAERSVSAKRPARQPAQAAPARPAAFDASPVHFASLKNDISRMSQRMEAIHNEVAQRPAPGPEKDAAFDEIRTLLDRMRPDQSIDALERRVEDLTSRIDKALESTVAPDAIEHLSERLDQVHTSLSDRLSSKSLPDLDGALEQVVRDIVVGTGAAKSMPDTSALETLMQKLTEKLDEPRSSSVEVALFGDLQAQVGKLAERIDRSDAGLTAIVSVERSLGELFSQMEETRDAAISAAEHAARTAARDTLRSAMSESGLSFGHAQRQSDAAVEQVTQDIADLRSARDAADKRLHAILNALNTTLEKVIDRLGALEEDRPPGRIITSEPASQVIAPVPAAVVAPPVTNPLNAAHRARPLATAEPRVTIGVPRRSGERLVARPEGDDVDFLIEPGAARSRDRRAKGGADPAPAPAPTAPSVQPDPASFIAAARRAAQAAAQSAQEAAVKAPASAKVTVETVEAKAQNGQKARAGGFLASRRRPLLLALAGLVVLVGAVQVARQSLAPSEPSAVADHADAPSPQAADAATPPAAGAASSEAPAAASPSAADTAAATLPKAPSDETPPQAAIPAAAPSPVKALPTLAMGAAANLAGARTQVLAGLGAGLRDMAEDGSAAAQYEVALRLADGRGVARDTKAAADWFERAAKQGLAPAAYRLGSLYEKGIGVAHDPAVAMQWYQKAAEAGNVRAMHNLAVMLAEGANGKSDYVKAATWFTKAAQAGVRDSQFNLAILYARGLGIEQSLSQSYIWFAVAAAQGDADATTKRDDVAQRLDAKALADAKKNADEFKPNPTVPAANDVSPPPGGWDAVAPRAGAAPTSSIKKETTARISSM